MERCYQWSPTGFSVRANSVLIYINDLDYGLRNWILKFADDTKVFGTVSSTQEHSQLQEDINKLIRWSEEWQMLFNTNKCKVMHFGRSNSLADYYMNGQKLEIVEEEKDLGVTISHDLKVSSQCIQAYNKASKILGLINRNIVYRSSNILVPLYKSLVRPHLEYCIAAWSPYYQKDKILLERIQRRFTRMIPGLQHLSYDNRLKKLKLWSLEDRRKRADLIEVYKMTRGLSAVDFSKFFILDAHSRTRGHSWKLKKSRCNTDLRQHFFSERIISWWNKLEEDTVTATSVNSFKGKLQKLKEKSDEFLPGH